MIKESENKDVFFIPFKQHTVFHSKYHDLPTILLHTGVTLRGSVDSQAAAA